MPSFVLLNQNTTIPSPSSKLETEEAAPTVALLILNNGEVVAGLLWVLELVGVPLSSWWVMGSLGVGNGTLS